MGARVPSPDRGAAPAVLVAARRTHRAGSGRSLQGDAWLWAQEHKAEDGSLPSGADIARQYGRHERWGRLVKRSGLAGELTT